jgi:hypothetical protein
MPSYLGGQDQEDYSLRPAQVKSYEDPISTKSWAQWHTPAEMVRIVRPGR